MTKNEREKIIFEHFSIIINIVHSLVSTSIITSKILVIKLHYDRVVMQELIENWIKLSQHDGESLVMIRMSIRSITSVTIFTGSQDKTKF